MSNQTHLVVLDFHERTARRYIGRLNDASYAMERQPSPEAVEYIRTLPFEPLEQVPA